MRPLFLGVHFGTSFSEVTLPTSSSDPDGSVKIARQHSGRPTGSPDESNTEI